MRFKRITLPVAMLALLSLCAWGTIDDKTKKKESQADLQKQAKITMDDAKKTALAKESGKIKEAELEKEKGRLIYSFDIDVKGAIHEVNVDAVTGAVVSDEVESPKKEAAEKKAERKNPPK
jgi:uncharacterized membrane protein YkoI